MIKKNIFILFLISVAGFLSSCTVGPDYHRPSIPVPESYKEAKNWQAAKPADLAPQGQWWLIFNSKTLNLLESQLNISNQTIVSAAAQYQQALFIVQEARAAYYPTLSLNASVIQQVTSSPGFGGVGNFNNNNNNNASTNVTQFSANGAWQADLWGNVRRTVEGDIAAAESSKAQLASARLTAQASLAQFYFELRGVDSDKKLLTQTVAADKGILALTKNLLHDGVDSMVNVVQARAQLETDQALLINLGINRGQYEHAIAVLIGEAPAQLSLPYNPFFGKPPVIPAQLPSQLLQRRPDIATAERNMAAANAQIGVAISAYFPTLNFSPVAMMQTLQGITSSPLYSWSVGPSLAQILFDGGLRSATTAAARANYNAVVATYRQTVLAAFQNVEDNLLAVRVLKSQAVMQNKAAKDSVLALNLTVNQFKAGTASYPTVLTAQLNAYSAEKSAVDVTTLRMTSTVALIAAFGGGFESGSQLSS